MEHADSSHLLRTRQSAYRRTYSTETAVTTVHNDIVRPVDQGHVAALVLLDLSAAFDTVDHSTLLNLLQSRFSVSGQCLAWFQPYLSGRIQVITTSTSNQRLSQVSLKVQCSVRSSSLHTQQTFLIPSIPHVCRRHTDV